VRYLAVVLTVTAVVAVSACGGGGDDDSDSVAAANEICREATGSAEAYARDNEAPNTPKQIDAALAEDEKIAKRVASDLEDLEAPDENATEFEAFVDSQSQSAQLYADELQASRDGDPAQFSKAAEQLLDTTGSAKSSAEGAGLTDCPYTPVSVAFVRKQDDEADDREASINRPNQEAETDIRGRWTGRVTQYGPGDKTSRYPVQMNIRQLVPGAVAGTVRYPTYPCEGQLQLRRANENEGRYVFRESIRTGRRLCTAGGTISTTVSGQRLSWRWVGGDDVEVIGSLARD